MYEQEQAKPYAAGAQGTLRGGAGIGGAIAPKQSVMAEHANKLHEQATRLAEINSILRNLIERMHGPEPSAASNADKQPNPVGALYVAQFGAERINLEISELHNLVSRLNQLA